MEAVGAFKPSTGRVVSVVHFFPSNASTSRTGFPLSSVPASASIVVSEATTAWAERGISMGTSSLHIPLISGLGPGVWDGKVVLVGMSVFVTGIVVFVAAGVGVDETM